MFISIFLAVLFFAVLTVLFFFRDNVLNWCRRNKKKALGIGITITVISAGTGYVLYNLGDEVEPPFIDPAAFIWNPGKGYGGMPRWEINKTYAKQFLKDNMKWRLQASPNNETWYDADELLKIGLDWIDSDCSYKVTLTLNTTTAPQSLFYRFDLACNKSLKQFFEIDGYEWTLTIPANNTMDYTVKFNWSDIKPLIQNGKVWFDRGVKNNFFWFRVQTVNKIEVNKTFVVDPVYGVMPAAVTDVYNWQGTTVAINYGVDGACRINNTNYYVTVAAASGADGWANVLYVWGNNGTIKKSVISSFEYDADNGQYASIKHIPGTDKYVVLYRDTSTVSVCTLKIWENGTISKAVIDQQALTYRCYATVNGAQYLLQVTNNVWVVAYGQITTNDGYMETVWIDTNGMINNTKLDLELYDAGVGGYPRMCSIDSNTVALLYMGSDNILMTYNISSAGLITDTPADSWVYEASNWFHSYINKIGSTVYEITYMDATFDTYTKTISIADTGMITKSWIDTLTIQMDVATAAGLETFVVHDPQTSIDGRGILGVTLSDSSIDGWIYTWNVTSTGTLDAAIIDSLEFNATDSQYFAHVEWVNKSYYLIIYTDNAVALEGWACTVQIDTNWASPVFSNPSPVNGSVGQSLTPRCAITVNDMNADTMSITFAENSTGSWVNRQTNSSVANGTYRWTFAQATTGLTKYWWKVYANDSMHNVSEWYCFTTLNPNTEPVQSSPSPANNSYDNERPITLAITVNDLEDITQDMNITWQTNITGSWVTFQTNTSVNNGTYRQPIINFTIPGHKYWWKIILNDGCGGWDNETYGFTIDNDTVWYKSSSYYCYIEINDLSFDPITVADDYVMFNTTDFKVTSDNRTNISIMFINTSITDADVDDLLIDFYAANEGGTVWFNISGFVPTAVYTVNKNGVSIGDYTANTSGDIQFNNTVWTGVPRFEIYLKTVLSGYVTTIRNTGVDYFVWLGVNTTAYWVNQTIVGMDEAAESISIWNKTAWSNGLWQTYNGTRTGINWTVRTFDIIRIKLDDAGTQVITMTANPSMGYTGSRAIKLVNTTVNRGYNFSGYNRVASTTLSDINTTAIGLTTGDFVARWNRTTFTWNIWISGFGPTNYAVERWDVVQTKVSNAETWNT